MPITRYFRKRKAGGGGPVAKRRRIAASRRVGRAVRRAVKARRRTFLRKNFPPLFGRRLRRRTYNRFKGRVPGVPAFRYLVMQNNTETNFQWNLDANTPGTNLVGNDACNAWLPNKAHISAQQKYLWNSYSRKKLVSVSLKCTNWRLTVNTVVKNGTAAEAPNVVNELVSVDTNMPTNFNIYYWRLPRKGLTDFKPQNGAEQDMKLLRVFNNKGYMYRTIYCPQHRMNGVNSDDYNTFFDTYTNDLEAFLLHYSQEVVQYPQETAPTKNEVPTLYTYFMLDDPTSSQVFEHMTKKKNELKVEVNACLNCDTIITTKWKLTEPKFTATT